MMAVARALGRAAGDAIQPRMLAIVLLPAAGSVLLWTVAGWMYWETWTAGLANIIADTWLARWNEAWGGWLLASTGALLIVVLLVPAIMLTAIIITELLAMPLILRFVSKAHYPSLDRKSFGTTWGSTANLLAGGVIFIVLWLVTLPLWFTVIGVVLVPAFNSAYLSQRIFRYDALAEHASAEEYHTLTSRARARLFLLGFALAVLYYVPVVNLVAPVLSALAYVHFCLEELRRLRAQRAGT
ncbi:MAG TPA: EI24 domain-containing protein [Burkholderiales bacterium]